MSISRAVVFASMQCPILAPTLAPTLELRPLLLVSEGSPSPRLLGLSGRKEADHDSRCTFAPRKLTAER